MSTSRGAASPEALDATADPNPEAVAPASSTPSPPRASTSAQADADAAASGPVLLHEYDGIQEYDNPMPRWWVISFWLSIVFALGYAFHYGVGNGESVSASYDSEMSVVRAQRAKEAAEQQVSEASLSTMVADGGTVDSGAAVFATRCAACHGEKGEGNIGPNLTDKHWLHGGQLLEIFNTVAEGVPAKGMPAWSRQLTPLELRQVVAYVGALRGTLIPGKEPQGELVP